jgi:hypothetical protein
MSTKIMTTKTTTRTMTTRVRVIKNGKPRISRQPSPISDLRLIIRRPLKYDHIHIAYQQKDESFLLQDLDNIDVQTLELQVKSIMVQLIP